MRKKHLLKYQEFTKHFEYGCSLLGNMLSSEGVIRAGKGTIRAGKDF